MRRNFSKLALALLIFATILVSGGHVATDTSKRSGGVIARSEAAKQSPTLTANAPWRLLRFARNDKSRRSFGVFWLSLERLLDTTVYASSDCVPASWEQGEGTAGLTVYSMASHPGSPNVYAGTWGEGVYRASSGANSWSPSPLEPRLEIASLAIDPASPNIVYAGTRGNGIFRSTNGGDNWGATTGLEGKEVWSLAVTSTDPIYGYAGVAGEGIYISIDGMNWDLAGGTEIGTEKFYALAVDPQDSRTAYVGTKEKGVYKTTDGGINWTSSGLAPKTVRALAIHPGDSNIIYAGTLSHGIFKSTDGGASWPVNGLAGRDVMAIAINPRNPEFVYAGTRGGGVWASYNGGYNWHRMPGRTDGASYVYSLTLFTPEGEDDCQVLYAGTTDGVWARVVTPLYTLYLPLVNKGYPAGQ